MDVSSCNSLLDLRFLALVLSRTLNGSAEGKKIIEGLKAPLSGGAFLFYVVRMLPTYLDFAAQIL